MVWVVSQLIKNSHPITREFRNVDNVAQSCILHDKGAQRELLLTQQNLFLAKLNLNSLNKLASLVK